MTQPLSIDEVTQRVFHVRFERREDLCSTFVRFQEHYESPEFRGKIFTLDEFKAWYTANSPEGIATGEYKYDTTWSGFNIPSRVLRPFRQGLFDPLRDNEKNLLGIFESTPEPFYIIGTFGSDTATLPHEIAHGLYATNDSYRERADAIVQAADPNLVSNIQGFLHARGYHPEVFQDETHAYLGESDEYFASKKILVPNITEPRTALHALFFECSGLTR